MKINRFAFVIAVLLVVISGSPASAQSQDFTLRIEAGTDYLLGYTQYGIGWHFYDVDGTPYSIGFEVSRLKFPLNSLCFYANAEMVLLQTLRVNVHFDKNITASPGKMEDSDWGAWYLNGNTWADSSSLDIFSTSDANLNIFSLDGSVHYLLPLESAFSFSFGVGFIYQHIYSEMSNVDQYYPSYNQYAANLNPSYANHDYVSGLVGTYRMDYFIPMVEVEAGLKAGDVFSIDLLVGATPLLFAEDRDDHILRSKLLTGDSKGLGLRGRLNLRFNFTSWLYAGVDARFLLIHAEGKQTQFRYNDTSEGAAGPLGSVDIKIDSMQFSAGVHVGVSF